MTLALPNLILKPTASKKSVGVEWKKSCTGQLSSTLTLGATGGRWGIVAHLRACCLGGAGFSPSTDSGFSFFQDVLGGLGQVESGSTKLFLLFGDYVSSSASDGVRRRVRMIKCMWSLQWTLSGRYSGRLVDATVDTTKTHACVFFMKKRTFSI